MRLITNILCGLIFCAAAQADQQPMRFVRMSHLVIPLAKRSGTKVLVDPLEQEITLEIQRSKAKLLHQIEVQLKASGGFVSSVSKRGKKQIIAMHFPFNNLQVYQQIRKKPRRLVLDIGIGRFLTPDFMQPWSTYLKDGEDKTNLSNLEKRLVNLAHKTHKSSDTDPTLKADLEKLALQEGLVGQIACIRLADMASLLFQIELAASQAETCLNRSIANLSPLMALAKLRTLAYNGKLFRKNIDEQIEPLKPDSTWPEWAEIEYRFALLRTYFARSEWDKALNIGVELCRLHRRSERAVPTRRYVVSSIRKLAPKEIEAGHFRSFAEKLLQVIYWLSPMPKSQGLELIGMAAKALINAGSPTLAVELTTWQLRKNKNTRVDEKLLRILARAFVLKHDYYRAGRTLDYLKAQVPNSLNGPELMLIRCKILVHANKVKQAAELLRELLQKSKQSDSILQIGLQGSRWMRQSGDQQRALRVAKQALLKLGEKIPAKKSNSADLLMLYADLAYELGRKNEARIAYRRFARIFPADARMSAVSYRIARLERNKTNPTAELKQEDQSQDIWSQAQAMMERVRVLQAGEK